ncbi:ABC transporter substrate-binding protein [Clostridium sp. D2Q-14]|uniref:ABC transporter substrate-binding protein n=1 Tax=Anaeromonas gelatinilytica TaxID=2683194 RepID=UPI00193BA9FB|nr:ABC transporter substrate-binding protein [Anaeromonas gelatinilytica]MBS4535461.1 ABC transporter substrate-binding protein [Anaeromonas gelatinilytica]
MTGCGEEKAQLYVYNWGDYIDEDVLDEFEEEYNVEVVYETYPTNEEMYVKINQGGTKYDVAIPSDYMIEKMIKEDLLHKIDMNNIENYDNVADRFKNLDFDPDNEYSVPYMWGTVGILYNEKMVDEEVNSWNILWDEEYDDEILMLDSQRDSFAIALKKLGYSINTNNEEELEEAKDELIKQKDLVLAYVGDEGKDMMVREEAALSVAWSGDATYLMEENENLNYVIPKKGSNLWYDNMVIPKTSENKELAEKFIDFMTRPDIALKNTEYIGYSTPNKKAMEELDEELRNNSVAYPSEEEVINSEVFLDPGEFLKVYDRLWTEVKAHQ